jgi:zinc protease
LKFADVGQRKSFEFDSEIPKGMVAVFWPTEDMWDIARTRRLNVLGSIFGDRLRKKVREELGEAYSPYARNISDDTYTGYGYLMSMITVDPPQAEKIAEVVRGIGETLAAEGIDQDELDRSVKPLLNGISQQLRNNAYWLGTVALGSQEYPQKLDWARSMVADYSAVTVEEVNALAKRYLGKGQSVSTLIVPKASSNAGAGGKVPSE